MDALGEEFYEARREELRERVGKKRFSHALGVAETAERLALRFGVDARKARLAGLLHDWDKAYDDEGIRARVRELGLEIDPFVAEHMPRVLHSFTAPVALARAFPEFPADVLQAIERHTVGSIGMSPLDMVLYIADAIEPTRDYDHVDELRALVHGSSLEDAYFAVYRYWVLRMLERGQTLHPRTVEIWNDLVIRRTAGKDGQ